VHAPLLRILLDHYFLPVISPVSRCADPRVAATLNVNGDDAAAAIAIAMKASELLFVSDVEGVFDDGLPIGLQLQGAWGSDALLLDAAEAIERATERRFVDALSPVAGGAGAPTST